MSELILSSLSAVLEWWDQPEPEVNKKSNW